ALSHGCGEKFTAPSKTPCATNAESKHTEPVMRGRKPTLRRSSKSGVGRCEEHPMCPRESSKGKASSPPPKPDSKPPRVRSSIPSAATRRRLSRGKLAIATIGRASCTKEITVPHKG